MSADEVHNLAVESFQKRLCFLLLENWSDATVFSCILHIPVVYSQSGIRDEQDIPVDAETSITQVSKYRNLRE